MEENTEFGCGPVEVDQTHGGGVASVPQTHTLWGGACSRHTTPTTALPPGRSLQPLLRQPVLCGLQLALSVPGSWHVEVTLDPALGFVMVPCVMSQGAALQSHAYSLGSWS